MFGTNNDLVYSKRGTNNLLYLRYRRGSRGCESRTSRSALNLQGYPVIVGREYSITISTSLFLTPL